MNGGAGRTLRSRVVILCVSAGLLLLGLAGGAVALSIQARAQHDHFVNDLRPARAAVQSVRLGMLEQRGAMRGYAVTGEAVELAAYRASVAAEAERLAELRRLLAGEPQLGGEVDAATQAAAQWRAQVADPVVAAVSASGPTAGQGLVRAAPLAPFTQAQERLNGLHAEVARLGDASVGVVRRTVDELALLLVAAAAAVLISVGLLVVLVQRWVLRPVLALAGDVRAVAAGDLDHRIPASGPRELNRLAADVDAMRRRVVADLAAVREAQRSAEAANAALAAQTEELTRSNRDLEQFAYVASHDLQEPLRKVSSFCQLLQRRYGGHLDERGEQYIHFAVDGAVRMQHLINDLLAFSRIGRRRGEITEVDLAEVMVRVGGTLEASVAEAGGEVTWSDLPAVPGEETLLTTLLTNLVGNAVKFRRPDTPPAVRVSARRVGDEWEIAVADNGIGIDSEYADKVFVIFQRLHGRDAYAGTGIGLAIVKKIVEYHGGRVWLDTDRAEPGTTVRFTLPTAAPVAKEPSP